RGRRAHDHRDDVAAVRGLVLDQPPAAVDAEIDAVAGHSELELPCGARPVVTASAGCRDQQRVRALAFEHLAEGIRPAVRVVPATAAVVSAARRRGPGQAGLPRRALAPGTQEEREGAAAELPRQLTALGEELERDARDPSFDELRDGPGVVRVPRP